MLGHERYIEVLPSDSVSKSDKNDPTGCNPLLTITCVCLQTLSPSRTSQTYCTVAQT